MRSPYDFKMTDSPQSFENNKNKIVQSSTLVFFLFYENKNFEIESK